MVPTALEFRARTDEDGWYQIIYKHKGKPTVYTFIAALPGDKSSYCVDPDVCGDKSSYCVDPDVWDCTANTNLGLTICTTQVQLKGNQFTEVYLELFEIGDPESPTSCTALPPLP